MWGKFAQGLKENAGDFRSGLAKLSDVVAPPAITGGDDDESEYEEEYEEYEEDDEEEELDVRPVIGFGAILSRIVAPEPEQESDEEEEEDSFIQANQSLFPTKQTTDRKPVERKPVYQSTVDRLNPVVSKKSEPFGGSKILPKHATDKKMFSTPTAEIRSSSSNEFTTVDMDKESAEDSQSRDALTTQHHQSLQKVKILEDAIALKDSQIASLQNKCRALESNPPLVDPAVLAEKENQIRILEAKCNAFERKPSIDPNVLAEKEMRIQLLEEQCRVLNNKPAIDPMVLEEKEKEIAALNTKCRMLQEKPSVDPSILQAKEERIATLEMECRALHRKQAVDPIVLKEKDERITELERKCVGLMKVRIDPAVVEAKNKMIASLEATCLDLQSKLKAAPVIDPNSLKEKDAKIKALEETIAELSSEPTASLVKDEMIAELESKCQELQSQLDQAPVAVTMEQIAAIDPAVLRQKEEQLSLLEQKYQRLELEKEQELAAVEHKCQRLESTLKQREESTAIVDPTLLSEKVEKIAALELICQQLELEKKEQRAAMEQKCQRLELDIKQREEHIINMQSEAARRMEEEEKWRESQLLKFKQDQAAMMEANVESVSAEYKNEIERLESELALKAEEVNDKLGQERMKALQTQRKLEKLLEEANARMAHLEADTELKVSKHDATAKQQIQKLERSAQKAEQQLVETRAILHDRTEELKSLKTMVKDLTATMRKSKEERTAYEEEMEHFREENETLHHNWQVTEDENEELKKQLDEMATHAEVVTALRQEIQELKDERERERTEILSKAGDVESDNTTLQAALDEANATIRGLEHQLAAVLVDLEVAKADTERAMLANNNLNHVMESFQNERDAEISLLEDQHRSSVEATAAAHAAAIEAMHQANEIKMSEIQFAADTAVKRAMEEVEMINTELAQVKKEKLQTRRSLDEAISRLQASQEDVVDRVLMKNVLLDWFARSGKSKEQVLEMMASMLHFNDEEKERIHIYGGSHTRLNKVYESVTSLPPPTVDVNNLQGDNVRDKFINFLLAESGDL